MQHVTALKTTSLGGAIRYTLGIWDRLTPFLDHPEIWLDNNPTDRGIRGPAERAPRRTSARSQCAWPKREMYNPDHDLMRIQPVMRVYTGQRRAMGTSLRAAIAAAALGLLVSGAAAGCGGGARSPGGAAGDPATGGATGAGGGGTARAEIRQRINLNQFWRFLLGDYPGAEQPSYDDSAWNDVGLPHSFSLPYFMAPRFYTGHGWYRRSLFAPVAWTGKRVAIEFQAVFQDAEVFVNGKLVGEHLGGYTGFSYDITDELTPGDNSIAVRVSNDWNARVAPRAGDQLPGGGITRDVFLVVTDPLHVAWCGTFVTTPALAANAGVSSAVAVATEIHNDRPDDAVCTVRTDIVDPQNALVATVSSALPVPAGATVIFDQTTPPVDHPLLWHPDHPAMYRALTTVSDGTVDVDTFTTPFGFRWFDWSASDGFSLNGAHLYLRGVNVHQDHAGWGDGVADAALRRDVQMVKDAGFNFIRGAHYPRAPAFADACDQLGVLLWSETCFSGGDGEGEGSFASAGAYPGDAADRAPFEDNVLRTLTDMIRVHRNHPSVVAWSMSADPFATASGTIDSMRALLAREVALSHQIDPTRPAAIGGAQRPIGAARIDTLGDIAGYGGDGAVDPRLQNPGIPSLVTEYGRSISSERPGAYDPGWGELGAELTNGAPAEPPWRSGQVRWCMFDHGSQAGRPLETTGIVDYFRIPKRAWYWYRNAYAHVPPPAWPAPGTPAGLALGASTTTLAAVDGTEDALLTVMVVDAGGRPLSDEVPVTLTVTSGPGEFPTGPSITFAPPGNDQRSDIAMVDGRAAAELRAYQSGTSVVVATSPGLASASVTLTAYGVPVFAPDTTPLALRAYSRLAGDGSATATDLTLALGRPASASSASIADGPPELANDGDPSSAWHADPDDPSPWWQVSLDRGRSVNTLAVKFPRPGNHRYTIELSPDGAAWTTAVDQSATTSTTQTQRATGSFGDGVRYVRVRFVGLPPGQPAGLEDVIVGGA